MKILLILAFLTIVTFPDKGAAAQPTDPCQPIQSILKNNTESKAGVCQMHITRKEPQVIMKGYALSPEMMDMALSANFQQVGNKAEVIGEFALLGEEINPVIDALRKGGIEISAVHNHMVGEQPNIYFLHFEGMGDIKPLAKTVKTAVDKVSYQ
ncbi:MAG: DUF1259 domain-containing protein [Tuberibacillus sp.]